MAIYQASFLSPANTAIDGLLPNQFSFICNGTTTKYNAKALRVSDNVQVYTTGDVVLSPVKYNGETQLFTVPALTFTNGIDYKWYVDTYEGTNMATSIQVIFKANTTPTLLSATPATITTQSYTFTFTYTQSENVPIRYWYMEFYDANSNKITKTDKFYNGNISYKYSGFVSNSNYSVRAYCVNENGVTVISPIYNFLVTYARPNILIVPTVIQDYLTSIINIVWGNVVLLAGVVTGGYTLIQDYKIAFNWALSLDSGSKFNVTNPIPENQTSIIPIQSDGFTGGIIAKLGSGIGSYVVGYDNTLNRFYFNNNGVIGYSQVLPLPTVPYFIFIRPLDCYVKINNILYELSVE